MASPAIQYIPLVCKTRTDLLDRLANAVERLGRAKLSLRESVEERVFTSSRFFSSEVDKLRNDCGLIRAELEYHRASHGC
jgi:hypothetical protein